jgi:hypothetical protein
MATAPPGIWILGGNVKDTRRFASLLTSDGQTVRVGAVEVILGEYQGYDSENLRLARIYACETSSFSNILKLSTKQKQKCDAFVFLNNQEDENQADTFVKTLNEWSQVFRDGERQVSVPVWILNFGEGSTDYSVWGNGLDEERFVILVMSIIDIDHIGEDRIREVG